MMIPVSHGRLEASFRAARKEVRAAAVLCHPHPVHGGTMRTKALYRAAEAMNSAGISVLRFNFRGVGVSTGSFDQGVGEQEDARAALDHLESLEPGVPLITGGYSFGAMVGLSVGIGDPRVSGLVALGLPLDHYDFSFLAGSRKPVLVLQGDEDEYGSGARVEKEIAPLNRLISVRRISDCDHYFLGRLSELTGEVREYFTRGAGAAILAPSLSGD